MKLFFNSLLIVQGDDNIHDNDVEDGGLVVGETATALKEVFSDWLADSMGEGVGEGLGDDSVEDDDE